MRSAITTHVLDTASGRPAAGVHVLLERMQSHDDWQPVGKGVTDGDGRIRTLVPEGRPLTIGVYRLVFDTGSYFDAKAIRTFYPHIVVTFEVAAADSHYHVPLLLSPFGYSTYRGS
jgi:5-hydroxyisourate hydrolase